MDDTMIRPRKAATAARIEVALWFDTVEHYRQFASLPFGPVAKTITDREWIEAWDRRERGVTARFGFTHTCRNNGAQVSDTTRFFMSTANASGFEAGQADVIKVELMSRDSDVPQVNWVERLWSMPEDFYDDPRGNPELAD